MDINIFDPENIRIPSILWLSLEDGGEIDYKFNYTRDKNKCGSGPVFTISASANFCFLFVFASFLKIRVKNGKFCFNFRKCLKSSSSSGQPNVSSRSLLVGNHPIPIRKGKSLFPSPAEVTTSC